MPPQFENGLVHAQQAGVFFFFFFFNILADSAGWSLVSVLTVGYQVTKAAYYPTKIEMSNYDHPNSQSKSVNPLMHGHALTHG